MVARGTAFLQGTRLNRELRIAFNDLQLEPRRFALAPQTRAMACSIENPAAVSSLAAFEWSWNAHEFGFELVASDVHDRVTVAAHVDE